MTISSVIRFHVMEKPTGLSTIQLSDLNLNDFYIVINGLEEPF